MLDTRVTVFKDDGLIAVDGEVLHFDFNMPTNVRCIQWDGLNQIGDIEYSDGSFNKQFYEDADYEEYVAPYVRLFDIERDRIRKEKEAIAQAELEEYNKPENVYKRKYLEINTECQKALDALTITYPNKELLTFDKQEQEAKAYLAGDESVNTDHIKSIAAGRGIPVEELAKKIVAKAEAFGILSGMLIGMRQRYEDQLESLDKETMTKKDIESIVVSYELPQEYTDRY